MTRVTSTNRLEYVRNGSRLCKNAANSCQHATKESNLPPWRIFHAPTTFRLNQSCAKTTCRTVFTQPRSKADKPLRAKIQLCPLLSNSGQTRAQLDCPLSANSGLMHRSKQQLYSITSSASC